MDDVDAKKFAIAKLKVGFQSWNAFLAACLTVCACNAQPAQHSSGARLSNELHSRLVPRSEKQLSERRYIGELTVGHYRCSVVTTLVIGPTGISSGTYSVSDQYHGSYSGQLVTDSSTQSQPGALRWSDKFGHGLVRLTLSTDRKTFKGHWYHPDGTYGGIWTGTTSSMLVLEISPQAYHRVYYR